MTNCFHLITVITHAACLWPDDTVHPREREQGQCLVEGFLPSSTPPDMCFAPGPAGFYETTTDTQTHTPKPPQIPIFSAICKLSPPFLFFTLPVSITLATGSINTWPDLLVPLQSLER